LIDLIALDTVVPPSTTLQAHINSTGITLNDTYQTLSPAGTTTLLAMIEPNLQFDPTGMEGVTPDLTDASDTGAFNNDNLTNDTTPTVSIDMTGKTGLVAGNIIQVIDTSASNAVVGKYTILGTDLTTGAWSGTTPKDITLDTLSSGAHALKTQIAESATNLTNVGAASTGLTVTVDTDRPTSEVTAHDETVTGGTIDYTFSEAVKLQDESDSTNFLDVTTNAGKLAIYAVDSKGDYSLASKVAGTEITAAAFVGDVLTITYTGTLPDVATSTSSDGPTYVVDAWGYDVVDLAGNQIVPDVDQIFTIADTTAPAAPTIEVLYVSETGVSPVDGISSDATPTVRVRLNGTDNTAPIAGDKVTLLSDSVSVGTATLSAANITLGSVDITATTLGADGIKSLTATIADQATTPNTSAASTPLSYTLDTTAPTASVTAHDEAAYTITYTFSEAVRLQSESTNVITEVSENGAELAIYAVTGTDYSEATKTGTVTNASFVGNVLTITYTGTLVEGTKYVVDAWGYDIVDLAGNEIVPAAAQMFTVPLSRHIDSAAYVPTTHTLTLAGTHFNTLLETGETAATDIKGRLDWTKLSWDINGDNGTTANVGFALADIASAKVTNDGVLTIVLATAKATALAATSGYGGTAEGTIDTLDVTAGFTKTLAGVAATTDAKANAVLTIDADTTAPTTTIASAAYVQDARALTLTGANFNTLLETGETAATDIKGRLDWTKLSWDINGDDGTTANVSFALADIASAKVIDATHLSIVLTSAKATALAATTGYGATGNAADTLDVTAGFTKDLAGNASTTDVKANAALTIATDTTAPTTTIESGAYDAGANSLTLTGSNFSTLLESSESAATDIKGRLDWSKLSWDINGDNATTANVGFTLADIASAKVIDGTHLSIVLTSAEAAALAATTGYGITGNADTLDVSAGFAKDLAGNVATSDACADGSISIAPVVDLNGSGIELNHSATLSSAALAFTTGVTNLAGGGSTTIANVRVAVTTATLLNTNSETIDIAGATISTSIVLTADSTGTFTLNTVVYDYAVAVSGGTSTLTITGDNNASLALAAGETLLDALRYHNTAVPQTGGDRAFTVTVNDGTADSPVATFTVSGDGDGIPDVEEDAVAPLVGGVAGDGNGDGKVDSEQSNVTSAVVTDSDGNASYVTIATGSGISQENVTITPAPDVSELPAALQGSEFLTQVVSFDLPNVVENSTQRISLYVDASRNVNDYLKQDKDGNWVSVKNTLANDGDANTTFSITTTADGTKKIIAFDLVDQGVLDHDRTAGQISDPGAPVFLNTLPVITSNGGGDTAAISVAENTTAVTTVTSTDADVGDTRTYSLSGGADQAKFSINAASGALTFASAPNYEAPTDSDSNNSYVVAVTATDTNGGADIQTMTVTVTDVSEGGGGGGGGTVTPPPTDGDGVADTIENGVPNSSGTGTGDGNGDGVADATQNNVTSLDTGLTDAQGTHLYATIQNSGNGQQANVIHTPAPSNAALPAELQGSQFPLGVFSFDVTGVTPGGATTISLFVDGDLPVNGYLKQNAAGQWVSVPITITPVGNQQRIDFVIVDNGPLDRNPASGSISDPGGPVFRAVTPPPPPPPSTNHAPTGAVTISGIATQGQTLTAANTLADADGLGAIGYQWQANGTAISGATASTYVLTQAEVGKTLTVAARYTDGGGTAERVTSSATAAVANVNDAPTGAVTITGNAILGQTLTATNTLADADGLGTIGYQWQADGTAIGDATASTYVLTQEQVGKTITVAASYTDGGGALEQVISSPAIVDDDGTNQAPVIASNGGGFTARLNVAENTTLVTQVRASDADGDALGYHLVGGVDQALFSLDAATGSLRFLAAPDYESPQGQSDIGADTPDNTYKVMVQVSDGQATDTQAITVTVTDVAENDGSDLDQDGMPDAVEAILGFDPQVKDNDVFANDALFVRQLYRDLLGREGEESGVTYWANDLQSGTLTRTQLIEPFLNSNEFQEGGGAIVRIYEGALGRSPDHDGFNYWMERVADGMSVRDIATVFADSEEFGQSYGALSDEAYVTTLTLNVLGREATAEESATWVSALADGGTRAEVLYGLVDSTEYRAASAEVVTLDMLYLGLLDRTLDDAGYVYWLAEIADADQPLDYVPNFYGSTEYHDRFLPAEPVTPLGLIGPTTAAEVTLG
jgi:hypothetical protein